MSVFRHRTIVRRPRIHLSASLLNGCMGRLPRFRRRVVKISRLLPAFSLLCSADRVWQRTLARTPAGYPPVEGPLDGRREVFARGTSKVAGKCEVCHHSSKPEKPLKSPQQACTDCHTKPPTPPVTTGLQAAFHNPTATAGLCITCHKTENSHGKAAPVKCADCHKRENS